MLEGDDAVRDIVARTGWCVMNVEGDAESAACAYTIGLDANLGHPELVVFGLDAGVMQSLLNVAAHDIMKGSRFEVGGFSSDVLADHSVAFAAVSPEAYEYYLGAAVRFYGGNSFSALQVIWPDRNGRYPWDAGVDQWVRWSQPALAADPARTTLEEPRI
jgi:hypothetical protein